MKFLRDENIPLLLVRQLEEKGYDIKYISTENAGFPDQEVIDLTAGVSYRNASVHRNVNMI